MIYPEYADPKDAEFIDPFEFRSPLNGWIINNDELVKSRRSVMPDLIRHPEHIEKLDPCFRRDDGKNEFRTFYAAVKNECRKMNHH